MTRLLIASAAIAAVAAPAFAVPGGNVPEIDATAGVAAGAALLAGVALLRERFKR